MMNQHHSGKGSGTQWSGIVGVDYLSIMAREHNGLGKHSLIHVSRILVHRVLGASSPIKKLTVRTGRFRLTLGIGLAPYHVRRMPSRNVYFHIQQVGESLTLLPRIITKPTDPRTATAIAVMIV